MHDLTCISQKSNLHISRIEIICRAESAERYTRNWTVQGNKDKVVLEVDFGTNKKPLAIQKFRWSVKAVISFGRHQWAYYSRNLVGNDRMKIYDASLSDLDKLAYLPKVSIL